MSEDILLRIIAQDQSKAAFDSATASVNKMTDAEKKSIEAAKAHADQMQKLGGILKGAALAGVTAVTAAIGDSIKETMDYNKSIRDLAQNLNLTTEATSRIVQTADDFTVSQEAVTSALQMAVKKGMAPNIETLARMADEYNAISDPTERAARLTEVFGRNWTALTPMLKEGGQAIRDAAAAQSDDLIVTEAQSKATRELEVNLDNLGDKVTGLKLKIGNALIPVVNQAADSFSALTEGSGSADKVENEMGATIARNVLIFGEESKVTQQSAQALKDYLAIKQQLGLSVSEKMLRANMAEVKSLQDVNTQAMIAAHDGLGQYYQAMRDGINAQAEYKLSTDALILSTQSLTKETLLKIATQDMDATSALKVAASMGMIDQATANNIIKQRQLKQEYDAGQLSLDQYIQKTKDLGVAIGLLPDKRIVSVEVNYQTSGHAGKVGGEIGDTVPVPGPSAPATKQKGRSSGAQYATGADFTVPPGYNENFAMYASSGEHVTITNNQPITNNFSAGSGVDMNALAAAVSSRIARQLRGSINSGSGYRS